MDPVSVILQLPSAMHLPHHAKALFLDVGRSAVEVVMIHVLVMLTAVKDGRRQLYEYESKVVPILEAHGGRILSAFRPALDGETPGPDEIHLIEFPSLESLASYQSDPRVAELASVRNEAIARTQVYVSSEFVPYGARSETE